jgi:hypothetical protein
MRRRTGIIATLVILVAFVLLALVLFYEPIEEGRCKLHRRKIDTDSQLLGLATQLLLPLDDKPKGLQDLPVGFDRPGYYEIKSGNKRIPVVMNFSEAPTLCLDTNGDGVLSQEKHFIARHIEKTKTSNSVWRFGPIAPLSPDGPGDVKSKFCVNCFRANEPGLLTVFPVFYRTGKLRVAGQAYRVAVVDGDCDGRFNSILSLPLDRDWRIPASDVFAIDLNRNGEFELSETGKSEVMPLGRLLRVANTYYTVNIASNGLTLALSRVEPQFGTLLIDANDALAELKLWSDAADQWLSSGRRWQLPAGDYKSIYCRLTKTDASRTVWTLTSTLSSAFTHLGALEHFTIKPEETTTIKIGPPFVVKADVQQAKQGTVSISPVLVGCAGEEYPAAFRESRRRSSRPTFKIVDEKGTVLVADTFQYG